MRIKARLGLFEFQLPDFRSLLHQFTLLGERLKLQVDLFDLRLGVGYFAVVPFRPCAILLHALQVDLDHLLGTHVAVVRLGRLLGQTSNTLFNFMDEAVDAGGFEFRLSDICLVLREQSGEVMDRGLQFADAYI